jgi:hypothetical protein
MYYNMEENLNKKLKYLSWYQIDKTGLGCQFRDKAEII